MLLIFFIDTWYLQLVEFEVGTLTLTVVLTDMANG